MNQGEILVVGGNKGGSSKTTTCIQLAVGLSLIGADFVVVNADPQGSLTRFHRYREESEVLPRFPLYEKYGRIASALQDLRAKYRYVLVDVPGRNSEELVTGMTVADRVIAPHQPSQLDLDTIEELNEQFQSIRTRVNPELRVLCYQSMGSTHYQVMEEERAQFLGYMKHFPDIEVTEAIGRYRKPYRDAYAAGKSVLEWDDPKAAQEARQLFTEVFGVELPEA